MQRTSRDRDQSRSQVPIISGPDDWSQSRSFLVLMNGLGPGPLLILVLVPMPVPVPVRIPVPRLGFEILIFKIHKNTSFMVKIRPNKLFVKVLLQFKLKIKQKTSQFVSVFFLLQFLVLAWLTTKKNCTRALKSACSVGSQYYYIFTNT